MYNRHLDCFLLLISLSNLLFNIQGSIEKSIIYSLIIN